MPQKTKGVRKPRAVTAVHGVKRTTAGSTAHVVGIGNLRVMITRDAGSWFAQALEIDYAAQGSSWQDVKRRFEGGLRATIDEHLKIYGSIEKLLQPAPSDVWAELFKAQSTVKLYTQVSVHVHKALPFTEIEYYERRAA